MSVQATKGRIGRVLVVDDDRLIREMISTALSEEGGFEVRTVRSGFEALQALQSGPCEVVLTDLSMREMDGLELLELIKRDHPKVDVIILTGYASLESALQAMRLGAADYLRKPIKAPEIVYAVRKTLVRRQILTENQSLRSCLQTFEASRVLAECVEPGDVLHLTIDLLLRLVGRSRAVGRLVMLPPRAGDGIAMAGFDTEVAIVLREEMEAGKLFDPASMEISSGFHLGGVRCPGLGDRLERLGLSDPLLLALPLQFDGAVEGGIWLFSDGQDFTHDELRRCEVLIAQAELALLNAERFLQARERAFVDDVTDLYNVRYLFSAIDREVTRAARHESQLSLLFLDLDRFKNVNDSHGHLVGSSVLRELGEQIGTCVRSIDTLARYGGDEFTVLLVDTDQDEALEIAERIRDRVATTPFGGDLRLSLTLSIGVSSYPRHGHTRDLLLDTSDKAMYLAKAKGRNRVCSADSLDA